VHVLVTGANGYIGMRLLQALLEAGHEITAVVRDRRRFPMANFGEDQTRLRLVEADFLDAATMRNLPREIDAA
jgi:nucleoside-diphosphate-sugar epimerase